MGATNEPKNLGIRIAQPYQDAYTADDKDLVYSSSFPVLKEEASGVINLDNLGHNDQYIPIYQHNLNYFPFFLVYDSKGALSLGTDWLVDANTLYLLDSLFLAHPATGQVRWSVYRLPLFTNFKSSVTAGTSEVTGAYNPDYGLKVARDGKDINSTDLRDFNLHSRGRSPLIHEVSYKEWARNEPLGRHEVNPGFSYNPIAFGFALQDSTGKVYNMVNGGQSPPTLNRSDQGIYIRNLGLNSPKTSIVVFKDPFLSTTTRSIMY